MKLSKTQDEVLNNLIARCNEMRSITKDDYVRSRYEKRSVLQKDMTQQEWEAQEFFGLNRTNAEVAVDWYEREANGYKMHTDGINKRTLKKLEALGYIKEVEAIGNNELVTLDLKVCGIE